MKTPPLHYLTASGVLDPLYTGRVCAMVIKFRVWVCSVAEGYDFGVAR